MFLRHKSREYVRRISLPVYMRLHVYLISTISTRDFDQYDWCAESK